MRGLVFGSSPMIWFLYNILFAVVFVLLTWVHGLIPEWWAQGFSFARFGILAAEGLGALGLLLLLYRILNVEILSFLMNRGRR